VACAQAFSYGFAWKESDPPANQLTGPNLWPRPDLFPADPQWRAKLERFYSRACQVAELVVRGLSLALGRDAGFLSQYTQQAGACVLHSRFDG
jgi:isopenicillin N synthase-like dioxygenase